MTFYLFNNLINLFSDSFGAGLTVEDIIDRLLSTEYGKTGWVNNKTTFLQDFNAYCR
jgi:hypothetical protein